MKELHAHCCNKKNAKGCWRRSHYSSPSIGVPRTTGHLEAAREFWVHWKAGDNKSVRKTKQRWGIREISP